MQTKHIRHSTSRTLVLAALCFLAFCQQSHAQHTIFAMTGGGQLVKFDPTTCTNETVGQCLYNGVPFISPDMAMTVDGRLLASNSLELLEIDTTTAEVTLIVSLSSLLTHTSLAVDPNTQFLYALGADLIRVDVNTGALTTIGPLPAQAAGDACFRNGTFYYTSVIGLYELNINDPINSQLISNSVLNGFSLTSNPQDCGELIYSDGLGFAARSYNIFTGENSLLCSGAAFVSLGYASLSEFEAQEECSYLDLDEDNSTGADDPDRDTVLVACVNNSVPIAPYDVFWYISARVEYMTIEGENGFSIDERLACTNAPNLTITGNNTSMLYFDGSTDPLDYYDALLNTAYVNNEMPVIEDVNVIRVTVKPEGQDEISALVTIDVLAEDPSFDLMLDDITICDLDSILVDASLPNGQTYEWSTGEMTSAIYVSEAGQFAATVTDQNGCETSDNFTLTLEENTYVSILWDSIVLCDETSFQLSLIVDGPGTVDVTIQDQINGTSFSFQNVMEGTNNVIINSSQDVALFISDVISSTDCIIFSDSISFIANIRNESVEVFFDTLCIGEIIEFGNLTITEGGQYSQSYTTIWGCDSLVTLDVAEGITYIETVFSTSCDSTLAGTETFLYASRFGCDSTVVLITSYAASDTTQLFDASCNPADTGLTIQTAINSLGCDSVILSYVDLLASDTVTRQSTSCLPADTGVVVSSFTNQFGCDSVVIATVILVEKDSLYQVLTSCSPADTGLVVTNYVNQDGCDSVVAVQTNLLPSSLTELDLTSCLPADTGVFIDVLVNQFGCDSTVRRTVMLVDKDSLYIEQASCLPADTGFVQQTYTNQDGCDSIVAVRTLLSPSFIASIVTSSCNVADTGVFADSLINQYGCDSIIITNVAYAERDTSVIYSVACAPADTATQIDYYVNQQGCDSVVINLVDLARTDSILLADASCNIADTGTTIQVLTNTEGCDSIIISQIALLPTSATFLSDASCSPADTGTLINMYENVFGCDSTVTINIELLRSDIVNFEEFSCSAEDTGTFDVVYLNINGCDSIVRSTVELYPLSVPTTIVGNTCSQDSVGTYTTTLVNSFGCDSLIYTIIELADCIPSIYIPNVFSPNNDGINDEFKVFGEAEIELISMKIFNRWGGLVYDENVSSDSNFRWNGLNDDKPAAEGVYIYLIKTADGREFSGDVVLVR